MTTDTHESDKRTNITIPTVAAEALCIERYGEWNWGRCSDEFKRMKLKEAKAELAAGIKAWPGIREHTVQVPDDISDDVRYTLKRVGIFLPLPKEPSNAL